MEKKDTLVLGGHEFTSRFILGSGKFSVDLIKAAVEQGAAQIVTMALRRVEAGEKDNILDFIPKDVTLLPNTSSARTAEEAVRIARLSREIGCGDFIKIEVMRDSKDLLPDNNERTSSRFSSTKSICPSSSTPASAVRPKPVKPWKWAPLLSGPIRLSQRPATFLSWQRPSAKPFVPAATPICPASAASVKRHRLQIRLPVS